MKRLTCEMCGSTNLVKQDGMFICQDCGTKYSVEEAKKMMVEGTVEVTGTVSIDRSNEINNRLANAINEFRNGNNDVVFSICSDILNIDPENYRAIIYKGLADGWRSSLDMPKLDIASAELQRAIAILRKNTPTDREYTEKSIEALTEMQRLGTAYFTACENSKKEEKQKFDMLLAKVYELQSKGNAAGDPYSASQYFNQAMEYLNTADSVNKTSNQQLKKRCANGVQPLNQLGVCVLSSIRNKEDVCDEFCSAMDDYMNSYGLYFMHAMEVAPGVGDSRAFMAQYMKELKESIKERTERERQEKIKAFWREHPERKEELLGEQELLKSQSEPLLSELKEREKELNVLNKTLDEKLESNKAYEKQRELVKDLEAQRLNCGLFQGKQRKALDERLAIERPRMEELNKKRTEEEKARSARVTADKNKVQEKIRQINAEISKINKRQEEITKELESAIIE